jgi:hypothetical protein
MSDWTSTIHWVFSGIGVLILGWLGTWIHAHRKKKSMPLSVPETNTSNVNISSSTIAAPITGRDLILAPVKLEVGKIEVAAPAPAEADEYRSRPTADEIKATISAQPLLLQNSVREHYAGWKFRWPARINAMTPRDGITTSIFFSYGDAMVGAHIFTPSIVLADFVWLKHVKSEEKVTITGTILGYDGIAFHVKLDGLVLRN